MRKKQKAGLRNAPVAKFGAKSILPILTAISMIASSYTLVATFASGSGSKVASIAAAELAKWETGSSTCGENANKPCKETGNNCNPYGPCEAWCGDFTSWVFKTAGTPFYGSSNEGVVDGWRVPSTTNVRNWFVTKGRYFSGTSANFNNPTSAPRPGDVTYNSREGGGHVGIVVQASNDYIEIISGNTGSGTNKVAKKAYHYSHFEGWGRYPWPEDRAVESYPKQVWSEASHDPAQHGKPGTSTAARTAHCWDTRTVCHSNGKLIPEAYEDLYSNQVGEHDVPVNQGVWQSDPNHNNRSRTSYGPYVDLPGFADATARESVEWEACAIVRGFKGAAKLRMEVLSNEGTLQSPNYIWLGSQDITVPSSAYSQPCLTFSANRNGYHHFEVRLFVQSGIIRQASTTLELKEYVAPSSIGNELQEPSVPSTSPLLR